MTAPALNGTGLIAGATLALSAGTAWGQDAPCGTAEVDTVAEITECVTLDAVTAHLEAWQQIADDNGGNRASGTPGYDASVQYIVDQLEPLGVEVEIQPFEFEFFQNLGQSLLARKTRPDPTFYEEGVDFALLSSTDPGSAYAEVVEVDLDLGRGNASTSGCEIEDYDGFPDGAIALVQRGACTFQLKAENAAASGASAVLIFNQGDAEGRFDLINATLSAEYQGGIPVFFLPYDLGVEFSRAGDLKLRMAADAFRGTTATSNVVATIPGTENPDNIVTVGGHLDSVEDGAGISDNATGVAAVLETAIQMAGSEYPNTLRFFFWGAEEVGLIGSTEYVAGLTEEEIEQIALYLNFDMIGSPNFVYGIYDGDDSDLFGAGPGPEGSQQIEAAFEDYFTSQGVPFRGTDFSGRSDYGPFIAVDIPAGGLFTGAEGIKTPEEAAIFGGEAGAQYDPFYHTPDDDLDNVSFEAFDVNSDAVAAVTLRYALSTFEVNGVGEPLPGSFDGGLGAAMASAAVGGGAVSGGFDPERLGNAYRR